MISCRIEFESLDELAYRGAAPKNSLMSTMNSSGLSSAGKWPPCSCSVEYQTMSIIRRRPGSRTFIVYQWTNSRDA